MKIFVLVLPLLFSVLTAEPFEIELPGVGDYILIVRNRSVYLPVTVIITLDQHFTRTDPGELLPAARAGNLFRITPHLTV